MNVPSIVAEVVQLRAPHAAHLSPKELERGTSAIDVLNTPHRTQPKVLVVIEADRLIRSALGQLKVQPKPLLAARGDDFLWNKHLDEKEWRYFIDAVYITYLTTYTTIQCHGALLRLVYSLTPTMAEAEEGVIAAAEAAHRYLTST